MILYKYMSVGAAQAIAGSNRLGFRESQYFNDPFELLGAPRGEPDPQSPEIPGFRDWFKHRIWSSYTAILSLTRDPLNPLMWAHYGDKHEGVALGIDVSTEPFTSEERNLVPVQHGSVVYTNSRPSQPLLGKKAQTHVGHEPSYRPELHELLQRVFLFKPACWAYEEEVRVVKCISGGGVYEQYERLPVEQHGGAPLYLLDLPDAAIREVYLGLRCTWDAEDVRGAFGDHNPDVRVFECGIGHETWELHGSEAPKTLTLE